VQTSEDAREIAVKKLDEIRLANERQNSADSLALSQGQANSAMRQKEQAESDAARAVAARNQAESDANNAQSAKAQAEWDAAKARGEASDAQNATAQAKADMEPTRLRQRMQSRRPERMLISLV